MRWLALILVALLAAAPGLAQEPLSPATELPPAYEGMQGEPGVGRKAFDLVLLRPLSLVQLAVGAVVLVPAWPVAWLVDADDDVYRACIRQPVDRTFRRPLGRL